MYMESTFDLKLVNININFENFVNFLNFWGCWES